MWVRPMENRDIDAVNSLEQACFTDAWSEALISNMFSNSYDRVYVLENDGEVIGYVNTRDIGGDVDLMSICVKPSEQGKGYAKLLMDRIMSNPFNKMMLEVRESNERAIALYEKYGFEKYARRKEYYSNPVEDAIIMLITRS